MSQIHKGSSVKKRSCEIQTALGALNCKAFYYLFCFHTSDNLPL